MATGGINSRRKTDIINDQADVLDLKTSYKVTLGGSRSGKTTDWT